MVKYSWSAPLWESFHYLCANCDDNITEINKVKHIIILFIYIIPCIICKTHAINYINKHKLNNINTKENLSTFMYDFHNIVKTTKSRQQSFPISILKKYKKSNKQFIMAKINIAIHHCLQHTRQLPRYINIFRKRSASIIKLLDTLIL